MRYNKLKLTRQQKQAKYWVLQESNAGGYFNWIIERNKRGSIRTLAMRLHDKTWSYLGNDIFVKKWSDTRYLPTVNQQIIKCYKTSEELLVDYFEIFL